MVRHLQTLFTMFALASVLLFSAAPVLAADKEEPTWFKTFKGHEMWLTSLDDGLAASSKEDKPMLIDLFSPG